MPRSSPRKLHKRLSRQSDNLDGFLVDSADDEDQFPSKRKTRSGGQLESRHKHDLRSSSESSDYSSPKPNSKTVKQRRSEREARNDASATSSKDENRRYPRKSLRDSDSENDRIIAEVITDNDGKAEEDDSIVEEEIGEEYEVERIEARREEPDGSVMYLVKWEGYPEEQSTWEVESNLEKCDELLKEFEDRQAKRKSSPKKSTQVSASFSNIPDVIEEIVIDNGFPPVRSRSSSKESPSCPIVINDDDENDIMETSSLISNNTVKLAYPPSDLTSDEEHGFSPPGDNPMTLAVEHDLKVLKIKKTPLTCDIAKSSETKTGNLSGKLMVPTFTIPNGQTQGTFILLDDTSSPPGYQHCELRALRTINDNLFIVHFAGEAGVRKVTREESQGKYLDAFLRYYEVTLRAPLYRPDVPGGTFASC